MSAPKATKSLSFKENEYKFLKLASIGFNNDISKRTGDFWGVNRFSALYFIRRGKAELFIRGNTFKVNGGDMFFINRNEPWCIFPDRESGLEYYWIAFHADYAPEIREILGFSEDEPCRAAKFAQRVEWIFDSLLEADSATPEVYFTALSSLMQILSAEFSKIETSTSTAHHKELAENAKQIIDLNFKNPDFSVNYAARMLYISHTQMSRVFKEVIGIPPVSYLVDIRLNFAAELLRERNMPVKELCESSGFSDVSHFMKKFKQKFGLTVREYRKQHKKEL